MGCHWTELAIRHLQQNDDVSCGVFVLKVIPMQFFFRDLKKTVLDWACLT